MERKEIDYKKFDDNYVQDEILLAVLTRIFKKTRSEQGFCAFTRHSSPGFGFVAQIYNLARN